MYVCMICWATPTHSVCRVCRRGHCEPCAGLHRHRITVAVGS